MNHDLEQFSEERLIEIAGGGFKSTAKFDEQMALARIALAAKQAKPMAWITWHQGFRAPDDCEDYLNAYTYPTEEKSCDGSPAIPVFDTPQPAHTEHNGWIKCSERMPEPEIPVLILNNGDMRIGEIRWDYPTHEETYQAFRYWDDPFDDGQIWDYCDITHWMPLPAAPKPESEL